MLLSIGELAAALGVSVVTLRRWDKAGKLAPCLRTVGGHRRYRRSHALSAWETSELPPTLHPE